MAKDEANQVASFAFPCTACLAITGVVTYIFIPTPVRGTMGIGLLAVLATILVAFAGAVNALCVWAIRKATEESWPIPLIAVLSTTLSLSAWLPLLDLLVKERSPGIIVVLPFVTSLGVLLVSWWRGQNDEMPASSTVPADMLFALEVGAVSRSLLLASCAAALALECAIVSLFRNWYTIGAVLFSVFTGLLLWSFLARRRSSRVAREFVPSWWLVGSSILAAIVLTALAFGPYVRIQGLGPSFRTLLGMGLAPSPPERSSRTPARIVTSMILVLPKKPKQLLTPVHNAWGAGATVTREAVKIPFDGVYWFFQVPDLHPSADARIIHGDPLKAGVHSYDRWPLRMEAHQWLPQPVSVACCRQLQVSVRNGETVPGEISLEVILSKGLTPTSSQVSLGEKTIPSSLDNSLNRRQFDEVLTFSIPRGSGLETFDNITVRIVPGPDREVAAPKLAIQSFALLP